MFTGNTFPKYLYGTPIEMERNHPFAVMEPNSGEQILPKDFNTVLSARQRKIIDNLQHAMRGCKNYIELMNSLEDYSKKNPDDLEETLHHIIEDENGDFSIGLQMAIKAAPTDFSIFVATAFQVKYNPAIFDQIYSDEDVIEVDDYTVLSVSATNAMTIIVQNCDIENPAVPKAIAAQLSIHRSIDEYRWSGVKCEILGGVPPIIIMRRWGLLDSTKLNDNGIDENTIFGELVEKLL